MKILKLVLLLLLAAVSVHAQTHVFPATDTNNVFTGQNTFNGTSIFNGLLIPPSSTVGSLPISPSGNPIQIVTDGVSTTDCTIGGGATVVLCRFNGSAWAVLGGGGTSSPVLSPNPFIFGTDLQIAGPNPVGIDMRQYGARFVPFTGYSTTATMNASSNSATVASASNFQVNDGVRIDGAGATCSLSTPSAPTVTSGIPEAPGPLANVAAIASGSSTYLYVVVARDKAGCRTAGSTTVTYTTGPASLGAASATVTSATLTNDSLAFVLASAPAVPIVAGSEIHYSGGNPAAFSGWFTVATVTDSTHFTLTGIGQDSRVSGTPTSATGGKVAYFVANKLTLTAVTGAWEYYIYVQRPGDSSLHFANVTQPNEGASPNYNVTQYLDFGTMSDSANAPSWLLATPPASAVPDPLVTTITNISGNTVTLAASSTNAVSGASFQFDNAAPFLAAAQAAASNDKACVYIPIPPGNPGNDLVIESYLILPSNTHVCQAGNVVPYDTIEISGGSWQGMNTGTSGIQFQFEVLPVIGCLLPGPCVYLNENNVNISGVSIQGSNNGIALLTDDAAQSSYKNLSLQSGSGTSDLTGIALEFRSAGNGFIYKMDSVNMIGGLNGADSSWGPLFYLPRGVNGADSVGTWECTKCHFTSRAIVQEGSPNITMNQPYSQGLDAPLLQIAAVSNDGMQITINGYVDDTSTASVVSSLSEDGTVAFTGALHLSQQFGLSQETGGTPGFVSGFRIPDLEVFTTNNTAGVTGQNRDVLNLTSCYANLATFGFSQSQCLNLHDTVNVYPPYTLNFVLPPPTGASASFTSGGSVATGLHTYVVTAIGPNGGESAPSMHFTATATSGTQTLNASWSADQYATGYTVYDYGLQTQVTGCVDITTTSCVVASYGCCTLNVPSGAGTGSTSIDSTQVIAPSIKTSTNCASAASPAVCGVAASGAVNIAAGSSSVVVDTTQVNALSEIQLTFDSSLGTALSVTCNTTAQQPSVSARTPGTSFTISVPSNFSTNPGCISYSIRN